MIDLNKKPLFTDSIDSYFLINEQRKQNTAGSLQDQA